MINLSVIILHYDEKGGEPICVSAGMIRQLSSYDDDLSRPFVTEKTALVVGDPILTSKSKWITKLQCHILLLTTLCSSIDLKWTLQSLFTSPCKCNILESLFMVLRVDSKDYMKLTVVYKKTDPKKLTIVHSKVSSLVFQIFFKLL